MNLPERNYETLDAIAVIASLSLVGGILYGFFTIQIDPAVTPVVASLATGILGIPALYGAFRWGNSVGAKKAAEVSAEAAKTATGALAQIAGAGPPPPAQPLEGVNDGTADRTAGAGVGVGEEPAQTNSPSPASSQPWPFDKTGLG